MFGLYMLAIYLGVAVIAAGFVALLVVVALAVGLVTHPIRTLALVFHKLAALSAGLALILALIVWFWYDHSKPDFVPCFWGSIGVIVASILIRAFAEWILERPTRAERRAMKRAAAQETGRVTSACRYRKKWPRRSNRPGTAGAPPYDMQAAGRNEPRLE